MLNFETKGHGRTVVISLIAVVFGGIAILWSWNTLAADLFALPEMEFRHAVAAELLLLASGALFGLRGSFRRIQEG